MKKYMDQAGDKSTTVDQRRNAQKEQVQKIIDQVRTEDGMFSYVEIAKIFGVTKERVRQIVKEHGLVDFKSIRREKALKKLDEIQKDPQFANFTTARQISVHLNLDETTVREFMQRKGIVLKARKQVRKETPLVVQAANKAEENGFRLAQHSMKEICDYFYSHGLLLEKTHIQIRLNLTHHGIDFKRVKKHNKETI